MINQIKRILKKQFSLNIYEHIRAFIGAFIGIGIIAFIQKNQFYQSDHLLLIGSFGATSVLLYGAIQSPLAQPRNLIGGHIISAFIGVTCQQIFPETYWLSTSLAVAMSIFIMQLTRTLHPPGGATALIAVIGSDKIKSLGYWYLLSPVLSGVIVLLIVSLITNNIYQNSIYPIEDSWIKKLIIKIKHKNKKEH
jgi:CBS-domain-containing membrane protein